MVLEDAASFVPNYRKSHVSSFSQGDDFFAEAKSTRPHLLIFSANDETSLRSYCSAISKHLVDPRVSLKLSDLAYTLSERRSRHFCRAYVIAQTPTPQEANLVFGKKATKPPKIGLVFTGQGAQWSQMGKGLVDTFPSAKLILKHLDDVLQALPAPPKWSLLSEWKHRSLPRLSLMTNPTRRTDRTSTARTTSSPRVPATLSNGSPNSSSSSPSELGCASA